MSRSDVEFVELRLRLGESSTLRLLKADDEASLSGSLLALSAIELEAVTASPSSATCSSCNKCQRFTNVDLFTEPPKNMSNTYLSDAWQSTTRSYLGNTPDR